MPGARLPNRRSRIRSPTEVPPGSLVRTTRWPSPRSHRSSRLATLDFPEPSRPSKVMKYPDNRLPGPVTGDFDTPVRFATATSGCHRVSLGELMLDLADAGYLGLELNRRPAAHDG